jgi:hypothetical protein
VVGEGEEGQISPTRLQYVVQASLFSASDPPCEHPGDPDQSIRFAKLYDLVRAAYLSIENKCSIDRLLADPDRNARFIQKCWTLGAVSSQSDLNYALLTARKNGLIGRVDVERFHLPREVMDPYLFAAEVALRILADEESVNHQRRISRDRILCEPTLGRRFLELARTIAPGYSVFEYRWAALTVCKGSNRAVKDSRSALPTFERIGTADSIRPSDLISCPGLFWMRYEDTDLYIGHAQNVRTVIDRLLGSSFDWMSGGSRMFRVNNHHRIEFAIAPCPGVSSSDREPLKSSFVFQNRPRLNFVKAS